MSNWNSRRGEAEGLYNTLSTELIKCHTAMLLLYWYLCCVQGYNDISSITVVDVFVSSSIGDVMVSVRTPYSDSEPTVFVLSPPCCVLSGEATHTNFIVLDLTRPELKPTIYHIPGEHANHYVTDATRNKDVYDCNRNQNKVSEWSDMSIPGLLFHWASTTKIQLSVLV
jgi:hypothetical protein